jgi:hypothetical protein
MGTIQDDASDLETKASAYADARVKAATDAATASASASAATDAHTTLQIAIAKIVADAEALDTSPTPPATP